MISENENNQPQECTSNPADRSAVSIKETIHQLRHEGYSIRGIARVLNAQGCFNEFISPNCPWSYHSVREVLRRYKPEKKFKTTPTPGIPAATTSNLSNKPSAQETDSRSVGSIQTAGQTSATFEYTENSWNITLPKTPIHTLEQLIENCKVDLSIWKVDRFIVNKWDVGSKDSNSEIQVTPLFQVKAWLIKKQTEILAREEITAMMDEFKAMISKTKGSSAKLHTVASANPNNPKKSTTFQEPHLLEITIPDLHMGKLAWKEETGDDYDSGIAEELFKEALKELTDKASTFNLERILFVIGNDLLNVDSPANTTTRGTAQSVDDRYIKIFRKTRQMIVGAIERLSSIAPVDVIVCPGNHDTNTAFVLGDAIECWFHAHEDVDVDNTANPRKYYRYNSVLLCFTHGDKEKQGELPLIMAVERPNDWGETRFREVHLGHLHKTRLDEHKGIRVRIIPALCAADQWHAAHGYIGTTRSAEAFVWTKHRGLAAHFIHNV